jgi:hypothetical protein
MTSINIQEEIDKSVPILIEMVRKMSWNEISNNYEFILTEIGNSEDNFFEQRKLRKIENDQKTPKPLRALIPILEEIYDDLYDINLHVYLAAKNLTVIDIRYYLKSSMNEENRLIVKNNSPMFHCKVSVPPWHNEKKKKFDINWEHNSGWNRWNFYLLILRLRVKRILHLYI